MYNREKFIIAYCKSFGATRKEAECAYKNADQERRRLVVEMFLADAEKGFYAD